jgi:hypothetical protein
MIKLNNLERLSDGLHGGRESLVCVLLLAITLCVPAISHATISSVSLVLSQNGKTAEIPLVADLFRSQNDQDPNIDPNWSSHTSDVNRWQLGIKWDNKEVVAKNIDLSADFDWCFKVTSDGTTSYYGPSSNETAFDGTALGSNGRVSFGDQKVYSSSSPVYFKTAGGAKSYTLSFANDIHRALNVRTTILYSTNGYPSAQIWKNMKAIAEVPITEEVTLPYLEANTVYFKNTDGWRDVYVYAWSGNTKLSGEWPGTKMKSFDGAYYYYTFSEAPNNVIFTNYSGVQTADLTFADHALYKNDGTYTKPSTSKEITEIKKSKSAFDESNIPSFYLLGNMDKDGNTNNNDNAAWDATTAMKMSPIVYYNADKTDVDSLVYQTVINKPTDGTGFQHVFFAFIKGTDLNISNGSVTGFKGDKGWEQLYRPEIHDNRDCNALESTLHSPYYDISTSITNGMQAVNPLLSTDQQKADFYILRFNATTSTYNIQFVNGKYIYGTGVNGGSWAPSVSDGTVTGAIEMDYNATGGYYSKTVTMTPGGKFGFCDINSNVFSNSYLEDNDAASTATAETGTIDYCNMAPGKDYGDVPYMNHVAMNNFVSGADAPSKALTFVLPTVGKFNTANATGYQCTIYLYPGKYTSVSDANTEHSGEWFYTYEIPVRLSSKDNTNYYTTYANDYPLSFTENAPSVYTAKYQTATSGAASVLLSSYSDASTYGAIPAKTGVVLKGTSATPKVRVDVSKFNASLYSNTNNELSPVYLNTADNRKVNMTEGTATGTDGTFKKGDAVSYRNYLMTFDANNKLVFSRAETGESYTNRAYLHLTGSEIGVPQYSTYDTEALYNRTYGLAGTENVAAAKEYGFSIMFEDDATTEIKNVSAQSGNGTDDAYYTMEGIRMSKPSTKGLYIHNGKKIIVK